MKNLSYEEAMLLVDNGHTVRRRGRENHVVKAVDVYSEGLGDWITPFNVVYKKGELGVGESAKVYIPTPDDVFATDWVVAE